MDPAQFEQFFHVEREHWWFAARRDWLHHQLNPLLKGGTQSRVLDVGCGTGGNVWVLKTLARESNIDAIDISEEAVAFCRQRPELAGCQFSQGSATALPYAENTFDMVTCLDILEHLDEPLEALSEASRVLKPGGKVFITVPAFNWLWGINDEISHHKRRYTKESLQDTLQKSSFTIEKMGYFNGTTLPLVFLSRCIKDRLLGSVFPGIRQTNTDWIVPPAPINSLLKSIVAAEAIYLPPVIGTTVYALLTKDR